MEVQKSNLSAFAVHPSAPILASGLYICIYINVHQHIVHVYACIVYVLVCYVITTNTLRIVYILLLLVCIYGNIYCLRLLLYDFSLT